MKIHFAADLNTAGAIDIRSTGNARLRGTPLGLSFYDPVTGESVLLAEIQSSRGRIIAPRKILYENIFDDVAADALYEITKSGLMQTIIIKERLAPPSEYGLPDETSRLEVITEFVDVLNPAVQQQVLRLEADPVKRSVMVEPDFTDGTLLFDDVSIPPGIAFALDGKEAAEDPLRRAPVGKRWQAMPLEGRSILFEAVEYSTVKKYIETLPVLSNASGVKARAALERALPSKRVASNFSEPIHLAHSEYQSRGFAVDYSVVSSISTLTFQSGQTYVISGPLNTASSVDIVNATFQAGCVIKYHPQKTLKITGSATFSGTSVNPSIFTSYNDNTYGETLPSINGFPASDGNPVGQYAATALQLPSTITPTTIRYVKVFHAATGVSLTTATPSGTHQVIDSTFQDCTTGIALNNASASLSHLEFCNVLNSYLVTAGSQPATFSLFDNCYTEVPKSSMTANASSFTIGWEPSKAINGTHTGATWHSENSQNNRYNYPQWLSLDLGVSRTIGKVIYRPRGDAEHGTFTEYRVYVTDNLLNWGTPVAGSGDTWRWNVVGGIISSQHKEVRFIPKSGRYVIFECLNSLQGWASAGEVWVYSTTGTIPVATPDVLPSAGTYASPALVTITCQTAGAAIWYTLDGTEPTQGSPSLQYSAPFCVSGTGAKTLKAKAFASGMSPSSTRSTTWTLTEPAAGTYVEVSKSQLTADASSFTVGWEAPKAIDSSFSTPTWHSENSSGNRYNFPQWLRLDLGTCERTIGKVTYRPRPDFPHGTFTSYKIYVTSSSSVSSGDWGTAVAQGTWSWGSWPNNNEVKEATFPTPKLGRFVIFECLNSLEGWASAGEVSVYQTAVSSGSDSDSDGLPDSWEIQYFGNFSQSASGDRDDDGLTNLQEYQQVTNPNTLQVFTPLN